MTQVGQDRLRQHLQRSDAVIGNDMRNSFELALDHLGRKMGGLPVEVIYEDDAQKPDVGLQKTEKLIQSDKVDFVVGYIWSNVLLASLKPSSTPRPSSSAPTPAPRRSPANCARPGSSRPPGRTTRRRRPSALHETRRA
jgi:hypothetical protein